MEQPIISKHCHALRKVHMGHRLNMKAINARYAAGEWRTNKFEADVKINKTIAYKLI